jgi:DNA invertase Pin-like site-specific DNA recombinase
LIDLQRERILAYAQGKNIEIFSIYVDIGYAGYTLVRPGLQRLLNDAVTDEISTVLVIDHNRLYHRQLPTKLKELNLHIQSIYD